VTAFRKAILILAIVCAIVPTGSLIVLDVYYYAKRPHEPQPELGRVYVVRVKGGGQGLADVYVTRVERWPFDHQFWLIGATAVFALAAYIINETWRCIPPFQDEVTRV
jgi:hypothetical protein